MKYAKRFVTSQHLKNLIALAHSRAQPFERRLAMKVLVLENDNFQAEQARKQLEARGCEVIIADSYQSGNAIIRKEYIEVVMTSLMIKKSGMNYYNGYTFVDYNAALITPPPQAIAIIDNFSFDDFDLEIKIKLKKRMFFGQLYLEPEKRSLLASKSLFFWLKKKCSDYFEFLEKKNGNIVRKSDMNLDINNDREVLEKYIPIKPWGEIFDYITTP